METKTGIEDKFWSRHTFLNTFLIAFIGALIGIFLSRNYNSSIWQDQLSLLAVGIIIGILIGLAVSKIRYDNRGF